MRGSKSVPTKAYMESNIAEYPSRGEYYVHLGF